VPFWFKSAAFITSKGYPDSTCRAIVELLAKRVDKVYYLGDEDIYGVDILLTYAIGFNNFNTILPRIEWILLSSMIDQKNLEL
jgi:DNA topoisomerase VI subunit A